jgi:hypothetical protein
MIFFLLRARPGPFALLDQIYAIGSTLMGFNLTKGRAAIRHENFS